MKQKQHPFSIHLTDRADRMGRLPAACAQLSVALTERHTRLRRVARLFNAASLVAIALGFAYCGTVLGAEGAAAFARVVGAALILSLYLAAFTRFTRSRVVHPNLEPDHSLASTIGLTVFVSIFVAVFGGALLFGTVEGPQPPQAVGLGLGVGVLLLARWAVGQSASRLENLTLDRDEIEWLAIFLEKLLDGLGPEVRCSVMCSPFKGPWGRMKVDAEMERSGYTFVAGVDPLCEIGVEFPDGQSFRFASSLWFRSKYKNRKNKYKGTKYRVRQEFHYELKGLPGTPDTKAVIEDALKRIGIKDSNLASTVKVKDGRATVVQVLKSGGRKEGEDRPRLGAEPSAAIARGVARALEIGLHGNRGVSAP